MTDVDDLKWYRDALAGTFAPIQEARPQRGFYRSHIGAAVAIWHEDGATQMLLSDEPVDDPIKIGKIWLQVARHPVRVKDYQHKIETGDWPTDLPDVAAEAKADRGPGDNSGNMTEFERMRAEMADDAAMAAAHLAKTKITDKSAADRATDWGNRLMKRASAADASRLKETEPLRKQVEAINATWNSVIEIAKKQAKILHDAANAWGKAEALRLQKIAQEEAERKWREEQEEAKRQRARAEEERRREAAVRATDHDADGVVHDEPLADELPLPPPPVVQAPKVALGTGTVGNRRSARLDEPPTARVVDLAALLAHLASVQHPDAVKLGETFALRAVRSRTEMPGIKLFYQQKDAAQ